MASSTHVFHAVRRVVRAIPDLRGKLRLARVALRPFRNLAPVRIPDRFGNALWCPSLEEPMAVELFARGAFEPHTIAIILSRLNGDGTYVESDRTLVR